MLLEFTKRKITNNESELNQLKNQSGKTGKAM